MKPLSAWMQQVNAAEQMFGMRENSELDPFRYDEHVDQLPEVAHTLAELVPVGSRVLDVDGGIGSVPRIIADARDATIVGIESSSCRAAAAHARGLKILQERSRPLRLEGKVVLHHAFGRHAISRIRKLRRQVLPY